MNTVPQAPAIASDRQRTARWLSNDTITWRASLLLTVVGCALLQLWRPFYFLTDDNLSGWLPAVNEFSRRLWQGQWPFIADGVFGGNFNQLSDPGVLSLLSPFALLFSWLSLTPWNYAIVDAVSICNALTIAAAFGWSALWLRRRFALDVSNAFIVLLTLSYTFSPYNLFIGSAWVGFLNPQASLPIILVGCLHPSARRAIGMMVGALLFSALGGHAHPFIMLCLFSGVVGGGVAVFERRPQALLRVIAAGVISGLVLLPFVWQAFGSFSGSGRAAGLPLAEMSRLRLELPLLIATMTVGPLGSWYAQLNHIGVTEVSRGLIASGFTIINYVFLMSLGTMLRKRGLHPFTWVIIVLLTLAVLMITRPDWFGSLLLQLPILRSLRWPFRELWVLLFGMHLFLLFENRWLGPRERPALVLAGSLVCAFLLLLPPPTLGSFAVDRRLLFAGVPQRYWTDLQARHGKAPGVVVGMDTIRLQPPRGRIPFTLLGTHNFGSLLGFTSAMGYTFIPSIRRVSAEDPEEPFHAGGMFTIADARRIAERHPELWLMELEQLHPPIWSLRTPTVRQRFRYDENENRIVELDRAP